jgi:MYXO-CTERM domain-containing protein
VGTVRVAAMGWTYDGVPRRAAPGSEALLDQLYVPLLAEAAGRGAKLVVSPEIGFVLAPPGREAVLARVQDLARQHRVAIAFGYFDRQRNENHLTFVRPDGTVAGTYLKTHLIPQIERYTAGTGELVSVPLEGFTLGGMICQDDNFTDLSRAAGRFGAHLVALPTNDWRQVKDYHLSNSVLRPIENRYGIVRAATNGTSAIVSPRGEVIVSKDHFEEGNGVIVADVPLHRPGSIYSRWGDWVAGAAGLALALGFVVGRRRRAAGGGAAALLLALLVGGAAHASGVSFTVVQLVLPDCTVPTQAGQWPTNAPLGLVAIQKGCTSAPGGPASCTCAYLPAESVTVEQGAPGGGWRPVPGAFRRSRRQCQGLDRLIYDRALLPGTYQVRAGGRVFGPLTVVTAEVADTARIPAPLPSFGAPCAEPPAAAQPGPPPAAAAPAPGAVPPGRGCASCAAGAAAGGAPTLLGLVALGLLLGRRRRVATPCRGRWSR